MKLFLFIFRLRCAFFLFLTFNFQLLTFNSPAQGLTKYGESTSGPSTNFVDKYGRIGNTQLLTKYGQAIFPCGSTLTINHVSGAVAPETKTVSYGTVATSLSGAGKCWITQN